MSHLFVKKANHQSSEAARYFESFKKNIIGNSQEFITPYGPKQILYADWTASGRMYQPIEDIMMNKVYPFVGNTHTETTVTGSAMTLAYHKAKEIIKQHVNASDEDILISSNSGMTGVINKFQRILGMRIHEKFIDQVRPTGNDRPIIFVSHMEHHSNQTSWLETIGEVCIINACKNGNIDLEHLESLLTKYADRTHKIAAITSCSNVTGIKTDYYKVADIMHQHHGLCFVDFACSAPYIDIDMHPESHANAYLDAIYFSPHKFLGGPSGTGILIFNQKLYNNKIPDNPGGGTVDWTNPWGEHKYHDAIEAREDGGTPAFLQTIRVGLAVQLKEKMGVENILRREQEICEEVIPALMDIPNLRLLAEDQHERLCVFSFYIEDLHYNLGVKILNDRFGIQVRGGCSCAGTYGHYLLQVSQEHSKNITNEISCGIMSSKPGWIRMSLHPTTSDDEVQYLLESLKALAENFKEWSNDYKYIESVNEFIYKLDYKDESHLVNEWFDSL